MTEDTTYNSWTNYPTWCVNLWLSNDEGLYQGALQIATETGGNPPKTADALKSWVEDMGVSVVNRYAGDAATGDPQGFSADLYDWVLAQVNWDEIADAWIEQAHDVD